jgi:hypothetical protein
MLIASVESQLGMGAAIVGFYFSIFSLFIGIGTLLLVLAQAPEIIIECGAISGIIFSCVSVVCGAIGTFVESSHGSTGATAVCFISFVLSYISTALLIAAWNAI